jgi:hypothetical protein
MFIMIQLFNFQTITPKHGKYDYKHDYVVHMDTSLIH